MGLGIRDRGGRAESAHALSGALVLIVLSGLQLHEAGHAVVASGSGAGIGARSVGGLDRGSGQSRSAYPGANRGSHAVGGRIRCTLRLPGF